MAEPNEFYPPAFGRMRNPMSLAMIPGWISASFLALIVLVGCSDNPVTGKRELVLYSTEFEIETGRNNFIPAQQASGGLYTVDPALGDYVSSVGRRIAAVSDRDLPYEFVVLNSSAPNAWALPGGKIAVNRGLLMEMESEAELAAVLAHEVVHAAARHGASAMNRELLFGVAALAASLGGMDAESAGQLLGVGAVAFGMINQSYSREAEREADFHGMRYMRAAGYDTRAAVGLHEKLLQRSRGQDSGWLDGLFASHPPSEERVSNNRAALANFPPGGEVGKARYENRLAYLRARKGAYDAGDAARQVLDVRPAESLREIDSAIDLEPREGLFHGLRGQALARLGRLSEAVEAYGTAIAQGPAYWEHFLGRGLAHDALGNRDRAFSDLLRSQGLLPTGKGNLALGTLALEAGRIDEAKRYFGAARQATGDIGAVARREYVLLDIADAPERYIATEVFFQDRRVIVKVTNRTDLRLKNVLIRADAEINDLGSKRLLQVPRLGPRTSVVLDGRLRYEEGDAVEVRVRVEQAQPVFRRGSRIRSYKPYP